MMYLLLLLQLLLAMSVLFQESIREQLLWLVPAFRVKVLALVPVRALLAVRTVWLLLLLVAGCCCWHDDDVASITITLTATHDAVRRVGSPGGEGGRGGEGQGEGRG